MTTETAEEGAALPQARIVAFNETGSSASLVLQANIEGRDH